MTKSTDLTTLIPVLTPCGKGEKADGIANFNTFEQKDEHGRSWRTDNTPIRVVTEEDIKKASQLLGNKDARLLSGVLELRRGMQAGDGFLRERAFQKILPSLPAELARDSRVAEAHFPSLVTDQLKDVQVVMAKIVTKGVICPALYCRTLRAAVFLKALIYLRSCPYCGELFVPKKNNVLYCSFAHREAYRQGRARWKQKQAAKRPKSIRRKATR